MDFEWKRRMEKIEEEVFKVVMPIMDEDLLTGEFYEEMVRDQKLSQYIFLDWLKNTIPMEKILYAGSGFDILPKYIFGEEKVYHTSLEEYKEGDCKYFPGLGTGLKVIADNRHLPFEQGHFDMVLFLGLPVEMINDQLSESMRVLKNGGLVVCDTSIFNEDCLSELFMNYIQVEVPKEFQFRGVSETSFSMFCKV
jgi:SAM-dependent methyltransferase